MQKKVCISPLDWGLGHATRCIPLIEALNALDYKIYIATSGPQEAILKQAIPYAHFLPLAGYQIRYTKNKYLLFYALLWQLPKILFHIWQEHQWLKKAQQTYQFDIVISDNRFGFFHKKIASVFITHQLYLQTPFVWTSRLYQKILYRWLKNFTSCWIPDIQSAPGLSGTLAHPTKMPTTPFWYMGVLSRWNSVDKIKEEDAENEITFLAIVSGPEPQRSLFEKQIWEQGNALGKKFVLVAGLPGQSWYKKMSACGICYHHLDSHDLATQIKKAKYIICRGGYTSLMELIGFQKKLILVPTPGQTEQVYLASHWRKLKWAVSIDAERFQLSNVLELAHNSPMEQPASTAFSIEALAANLKTLNL